MSSPTPTTPKRNLWPYAIIATFVLFAAYIGSMVQQAMRTNVELVSPDYYKQELAFQQRIETVARTAALPSPVLVHYNEDAQRLTLQLPATLAGQAVRGQVHFFRPSDQKLDFALPLLPAADLVQRINTSKMRPGYWRVRLDFTAGGQAYFLEKNLQIK